MNNKKQTKNETVNSQLSAINCNYDTTSTIDKLANVWNIFNEMSIAGVLDGKIVEVEFETLLTAVGDAEAEFQSFLNNNMSPLEQFTNMLKEAGRAIIDGFADSFAQAIVYGKKFSDSMKALFKNLVAMIISELMKLLVWKAILAVGTGGASKTAEVVASVAAASGGYIAGPGTGTSDSIPARLSNGEYVINAQKTSIFKPLLDIINYAPLPSIQKILAGLQMPTFTVPQLPIYAYATGGYVAPHSMMGDITSLESRIDNMTDRLENALDRLEKKEYNVQVKTSFKGVEFAEEIDKAKEEQRRRLL